LTIGQFIFVNFGKENTKDDRKPAKKGEQKSEKKMNE